MKILYYNTSYESFQQISMLLSTLNIPVIWIQQNQGSLTINDFIKQTSSKADPCSLPDITVMIFHEMSDEQINGVTALLKQHEITIPYRCVVTKHNQEWRFIDLFQELMKEHEYFNNYNQLKQCIAQVSELHETDYSEESWKQYEAAFMIGYFMLQKQSSVDELKNAVQAINDAKTKLSKKV